MKSLKYKQMISCPHVTRGLTWRCLKLTTDKTDVVGVLIMFQVGHRQPGYLTVISVSHATHHKWYNVKSLLIVSLFWNGITIRFQVMNNPHLSFSAWTNLRYLLRDQHPSRTSLLLYMSVAILAPACPFARLKSPRARQEPHQLKEIVVVKYSPHPIFKFW